ncbi:hypothetical protein [Paenibacillus lutrae]|uniref:Uncharacterized protein n=1 Tax=Paenibacillus lutrae TaxID=2078573 RepID=A0A7X3FHU0_9BACL|nr:hypothetical protein [Paenibacillus lutrae]MVO99924.1 hypothetical protein [Paenibacillus lutrae]
MNFFKKSTHEIRTPFELDLLGKAQNMQQTVPPEPWIYEVIVPASGVTACGWDEDENLVLISGSGYSITQAITGKRIHRDRDSSLTDAGMSKDYLTFTVPLTGLVMGVFGFEAGDGIFGTDDGWRLDVIYPWWPRASVVLDNVFRQGYRYLEDAVMIDLKRLDGPVKCGFSPSGRHFVVLGSGGALVYSR